jgi:hypothetical protein
MPKRARSGAEIRHELEQDPLPLANGRSRRPGSEPVLDRLEKITAVCELFCQGLRVREIQAAMRERYGEAGRLTREEPYRILSYAAAKGWLRFRPPPHQEYAQALRGRHPWLASVDVVHTTVVADVARRAAEVLIELLQGYGGGPQPRREVHIGLGGGLTMRLLAQALADELCRPHTHLPETLVFHALVSGFDYDDPTTIPGAFFSYFLREPVMQIKPRFIGFNAPCMVRSEELANLMQEEEIAQAHAAVDEIDIFVTTGADCERHSALYRRMHQSPDALRELVASGWAGDIFWRPLGPSGPIHETAGIRAMTLVELDRLPEFIRRGRQVLLLLGPCADCQKPKDGILETVLQQQEHYVTHLVVDSRTAGQVVNRGRD